MTPQGEDRPAGTPWLLKIALLAVLAIASVRAFGVVDEYAANVPYSDQWDLLNPLFEGRSIAGWFLHQHGPHRQGVGGVLTAFVGRLTDFDGRAEAFLCLSGIWLAMLVAIALRWRLNGRLGWLDAVLPLAFLSIRHGHHLAVVPNNAHSTTPLMLVLSLGLLMTLSRSRWRAAALIVVGTMTTYTGFGLFVAPLVPLFFLMDAHAGRRAGDRPAVRDGLVAFVIAAATNATFFFDYRQDSANPNFGIASPTAYLTFLGDLFGLTVSSVNAAPVRAVGWLLLVTICVVALIAAFKSLRTRDDPANERKRRALAVIWFLATFSLLFAIGTAIGRTTYQPNAGSEPRYFALLLPGLVALSLAVERLPRPWPRRMAIIALATTILIGHAVPTARERASQADYRDLKQAWRAELDRSGDVASTYARFRFDIYANPKADHAMLDRKLRFFRERRLGPFRVEDSHRR